MEKTILNGQSILDIAVQASGSVEGAIDIALANDMDLTGLPVTGESIEIPSVHDKQVAAHYNANNLTPATVVASEEQQLGGIGTWVIGEFVIP